MTSPRLVASLSCLLLFGLARLSYGAPCSLESEAAEVSWATVSPTGSTPFRLNLDKRPLTATPGPEGVTTLEVRSPLRFFATQSTNALGARLEKRTAIAGGRIVLAKDLHPNFPDMAGKAFTTLAIADTIAVQLPLAGFSATKTLALPCAALTIANTEDDYSAPIFSQATQAVRYVNIREPLSLYAKRELVDPLEVHLGAAFVVVAERDHWVRLRATWSDGSLVQGWVPMDAVTIVHGVPPEGVGGFGIGGMQGLCGSGGGRAVTEVQLHSHAPIHDGPGGAIWAHTAANIKVQVFAVFRSDGWIQISKVEGFPKAACSEHTRIWVHAEHVLWSPVAAHR